MNHEERQKLREVATRVIRLASSPNSPRPSHWELQTSNSYRRIGQYGDGDVLCAITQRSDGHPDLLAPAGVLEHVVAAQPRVVLELLDQIEELRAGIERILTEDRDSIRDELRQLLDRGKKS